MSTGDAAGSDPGGQRQDRLEVASVRDQAARRRDVAGALRDTAGEGRDNEAEKRDRLAEPVTPGERSAATDRTAAADDRQAAARDRASALSNRQSSAQDRHHASLDGLTGVYNRQTGLLELGRELDRAGRTGHPLVLAFIDVDQLKAINDNLGHAAGDAFLAAVARTLSAALRPYDLVIRYGGDEFLCAAEGIDLAAARPRFARINTLLAEAPHPGSVTVGLAQLRPADSCRSLIARADADLYRQRQH